MYTSTELQLLRNADPGVQIPGIDTSTGNSLSASSLTPLRAYDRSVRANLLPAVTPTRSSSSRQGVDLNGYDFGDAWVTVNADDVTIENSTFTATSGYSAIQVDPGYADTTVTHVTFDSGGVPSELAAWVISNGKVDVTDNHFIDTPYDGVDVTGGGVISGNYFSGGGYTSNGGHPDAIWITDSTNADVRHRQFHRLDRTNRELEFLHQRLRPHHHGRRRGQQRHGERKLPVRRHLQRRFRQHGKRPARSATSPITDN